jgi:hypothetical protein
MYWAIGVEPTNEIDWTTGEFEQAVDGLLVALQHGEDAVRQAGFLPQVRDPQGCRRVLLGRLQNDGVAAAIAMGKNHIGTMTGKLKGLMTPTTPSGCFGVYTSMPVAGRDVAGQHDGEREPVRTQPHRLQRHGAALREAEQPHRPVVAGGIQPGEERLGGIRHGTRIAPGQLFDRVPGGAGAGHGGLSGARTDATTKPSGRYGTSPYRSCSSAP